MFGQTIPHSVLWLVCIWAVLSVGLSGCGGDDYPWTGTWSLQTVDGENWKLLFALFGATIEDKWTFHDDGTWELEMTVTVLSEKETVETSGTYSVTDTSFSMSSPDPEFSLDFSISFEDDSLDSEQSSEPKEETGTWVRDGNTLTLTLSNGQVLVFEKL